MGISVYYKPAVIIGDGGGDGGDSEAVRKAFAETLAGTISSIGSDVAAGISTILVNNQFFSNLALTYAYFPDLLGFYNNKPASPRNATNVFAQCIFLSEFHGPELSQLGTGCFSSCIRLPNFEGPNVLEMSAYAFYYCYSLESVSLPKCVFASYAYYAFTSCIRLSSVYIPYAVSLSTTYIFTGCESMSNFRGFLIPQEIIGDSAFYSTALSSIEDIPAWSLATSIGNQAFAYCPMSEISFINCSSIASQSFMSSTLTNIYLPLLNSMTAYSNFASCSLLSQVYAPNCSSAYYYNFFNCKSLEKVELGLGQNGSIPQQCFGSCSKLSEIYMINYSTSICTLQNQNAFSNTPMSNSTYLGYYGSIYVAPTLVNTYKTATNWAAYANRIAAAPESFLSKAVWPYQYYNSNTMATIPSEKENVTAVHRLAFCNCQSLTAVSLSLCEYIGAQAFEQCYSISAIDLPQCKVVGMNAFQGCTGIFSVNIPECLAINRNAFYNCQTLTTLNANKCEVIYSSAFCMCYSLSTVNLSKCKEIYGTAFMSCRSLVSIDLPECLAILQSAFAYCYSLSSISAPKCVFIDTNAFMSCSDLVSINLPKALALFQGCFSSCSKLETVILSECDLLETYAFFCCYSLSNVSLPECRFVNGEGTFKSCSNLRILSLPKLKILGNCFGSCINLSQLYLPSNKMAYLVTSSAFNTTPIGTSSYLGYFGSIYVPASLISQYQNDPVWSWFSSRFASIT